MKISVLVVSLNAGDALNKTVASILTQENADFEIIVKDGGSTDGSVAGLPNDPRIRVVIEKDTGIYDAMNQAAQYVTGDVAMYMNCGDLFYNSTVLKDISEQIGEQQSSEKKQIFYGDCYTANRDYILRYPEKFDDYLCYTMVLCHQTTIYPAELLKQRRFSETYKMAADFEYYVYAYKNGYALTHLPVVIAWYEGNGASEKRTNRRLALEERERAVRMHFSKADYRNVRRAAMLRGVGIKHFLVKQEWFYPYYRKIAQMYYKIKNS